MPRSPRKQKTKSTSKSPVKSKRTDHVPTTPLADASNVLNNPPPATPRVIDFTLALDESNVDGWSSDDSFEEKITWSRHRMRVTPGGFTPRNIQEVRRRLNLANLPEDMSPAAKPITLKKNPSTPRPSESTPVKTFLAKDPDVLPPSPSPKKTPAAEKTLSPVKTRLAPKGSPLKMETAVGGGIMRLASPSRPASPLRPASPSRQPVTQVMEFKFATETRSRRSSPEKKEATLGKERRRTQPSTVSSPRKSTAGKRMDTAVDKRTVEQTVVDDEIMEDDVDEGLAVRMRAHEIGKASILAWGETRGRYLDN